MKFSIYFFLFLLFFVSVFTGCSRKNGTNDNIYIPEQLKQYSIFQAGSYWIYQKSSNGETDSSYLLHAPDFHMYHVVGVESTEEMCENNYGGNFINSTKVSPNQYNIVFTFYVGAICLLPNFQMGYTIGNLYGGIYTNLEFYDSLAIEDQTFHKVIKTQNQIIRYPDDTVTQTFYLAKYIGLIKYQYWSRKSDTTWSLLRYHIIL